ncbi:hypothetical protein D3C85_809290 [compost metagenome]
MQYIGRIVLGDALFQRLQAGAHARHGAVVVAALDVHGAMEAALPFGLVISHVGHEVGVAAFAFAHDAVFVVARAEFGRAQPQRAAFLVGVAAGDQGLDRGFHASGRVERAFQVVVVERQAEGLQVQILLAAQISHGEDADVVQAFNVAGGGDGLAVGRLDGLASLEVAGDVGDVVALVAVGGPVGGFGRQAAGAGLHADGQVMDLVAGVVVVELARDIPAAGVVQAAQGVAQRGLAGVAHVQRAGGIGRDELDQDLLAAARGAAERGALLGHGRDDGLAGGGGDAQVDEAGAGHFRAFDQRGRIGVRQQRAHDGLGQFAGVAAGGLGQLHGHVGGDVAVRGNLRALQEHVRLGRIGLGVGQALRDGGLDQGDKLCLLLEEHGRLEMF